VILIFLLLLLLVLFEILLVILLFLSDGLLVRRERDTPLCSLSGSRDPGVRGTHAQVGATLRARVSGQPRSSNFRLPKVLQTR
jgi:hypothetical protein